MNDISTFNEQRTLYRSRKIHANWKELHNTKIILSNTTEILFFCEKVQSNVLNGCYTTTRERELIRLTALAAINRKINSQLHVMLKKGEGKELLQSSRLKGMEFHNSLFNYFSSSLFESCIFVSKKFIAKYFVISTLNMTKMSINL